MKRFCRSHFLIMLDIPAGSTCLLKACYALQKGDDKICWGTTFHIFILFFLYLYFSFIYFLIFCIRKHNQIPFQKPYIYGQQQSYAYE